MSPSLQALLRVSRYLWLIACLAPGLLYAGDLPPKPQVERVSFDRRASGRGYVIRFQMTGPVSAFSEPRFLGEQLEVELFNTDLSSGYTRLRPEGPVLSYTEETVGEHLRFLFRLDPQTPLRVDIYPDAVSDDILVALTYQDDRPLVVAAPPETLAPREMEGDANTAVRAIRDEGARWRLDTIVIDAGHGGKDAGAVANGVREKDVTLAVARKLGAAIESRLGVNVVYTRSDDRFIELRERGRRANEVGAKLFISIHVNAAKNTEAHGTETYFLGMHKTEAARQVMERENEVVKLEDDPGHYADLTEQMLIRQTLLQSANMRRSEDLAALLEREFSERVGRKSRGVKQAGFLVLWGASMPAILVELGFATHREEARFLRSERGQTEMAEAIFRAVKVYKEHYEKGLLVQSAQE